MNGKDESLSFKDFTHMISSQIDNVVYSVEEQTIHDQGLTYTVDNFGDAQLTNVNTNIKSVQVPQSINGFSVTALGSGCLHSSVDQLILPEGIKTIYDGVDSPLLCSINLPETIIEIGSACFMHLPSNYWQYIPSNVQIIGKGSFKGCCYQLSDGSCFSNTLNFTNEYLFGGGNSFDMISYDNRLIEYIDSVINPERIETWYDCGCLGRNADPKLGVSAIICRMCSQVLPSEKVVNIFMDYLSRHINRSVEMISLLGRSNTIKNLCDAGFFTYTDLDIFAKLLNEARDIENSVRLAEILSCKKGLERKDKFKL